jgi:hypothetical protein
MAPLGIPHLKPGQRKMHGVSAAQVSPRRTADRPCTRRVWRSEHTSLCYLSTIPLIPLIPRQIAKHSHFLPVMGDLKFTHDRLFNWLGIPTSAGHAERAIDRLPAQRAQAQFGEPAAYLAHAHVAARQDDHARGPVLAHGAGRPLVLLGRRLLRGNLQRRNLPLRFYPLPTANYMPTGIWDPRPFVNDT